MSHDPEPDFTPSSPAQPMQPGRQPVGPMPDQNPAPPQPRPDFDRPKTG